MTNTVLTLEPLDPITATNGARWSDPTPVGLKVRRAPTPHESNGNGRVRS